MNVLTYKSIYSKLKLALNGPKPKNYGNLLIEFQNPVFLLNFCSVNNSGNSGYFAGIVSYLKDKYLPMEKNTNFEIKSYKYSFTVSLNPKVSIGAHGLKPFSLV